MCDVKTWIAIAILGLIVLAGLMSNVPYPPKSEPTTTAPESALEPAPEPEILLPSPEPIPEPQTPPAT